MSQPDYATIDSREQHRRPGRRSSAVVVAICFATLIFDGYDLVVYGATVPSILAYEGWNVTPGQAGFMGSAALVGMLIGALTSGSLSARIGARAVTIGSIVVFSAAMGFAAVAPTPEIFALVRFVGGIGLGGVIPTVISLIVEYSPHTRRQLNNALIWAGYSIGGITSAVTAMILLPEVSFRWLYAIGMLPLILIVPVAWRVLPESRTYLASRGRHDEVKKLNREFGLPALETRQTSRNYSPVRHLLSAREARISLTLFVAATFCGLLLIYSVSTWLPNIMRQAGFSLGSSLSFLLALNVGAIIGGVSASAIADRIGNRYVIIVGFGLAITATTLLSFGLPAALLYVLVVMAGMGTTGTMVVILGYAGVFFPEVCRTAALGLVLGFGRLGAIFGPILGGWIAASTLGYQWNFYIYACFAAVGGAMILLLPRSGTVQNALSGARADSRLGMTARP